MRSAGQSVNRPPSRSKQLSVRRYFTSAHLPSPEQNHLCNSAGSSPRRSPSARSRCEVAAATLAVLKESNSGSLFRPGHVDDVGRPRIVKISSTMAVGLLFGLSMLPPKKGCRLPAHEQMISAKMQPTDHTSSAGPYLASPSRSSMARYGRETIMFGFSRSLAEMCPNSSSCPKAIREMPKSQTLISPERLNSTFFVARSR
mmetsp:Transcript_106580/g.278276  ORF Transcript_106580/g.278276 Transcript_106580/m.278276 type:complete len:201 (+) Transcript_106580:535-1137(+)